MGAPASTLMAGRLEPRRVPGRVRVVVTMARLDSLSVSLLLAICVLLAGCERPAPPAGAATPTVQQTFAVDNVSVGVPADQVAVVPVPARSAAQLSDDERQALIAAVNAGVKPSGEVAVRSVRQLAASDKWALASWTQGEGAGQTLLRRSGSTWRATFEQPGWMGLAGLRQRGVEVAVAVGLLESLDPSWRNLEGR